MLLAVTAASGKLGGEIAQALVTMHGDESVVGLARTPKNAERLGIEVRPGDYDQPEQLASSLSGVDSLVLLSGMDAPDKRVQQHRNVIDAARAAGVRKIVYTSIQGLERDTGFSDVVQSNRQTEADIRASGLDWVIGRNGIYIEPDLEYLERYEERGEIANCAGDGKCGYTTRKELAYAYARVLTGPEHDGRTYDLHGEPITQAQLDEHVQLTLTDRTRRFRGVVMSERTWSFIDQFNRLDFVLNGFGWCVMPTHLAWPHIENGDLSELRIAIHRGRPLRFPLYTAHKLDQPPGPAAVWLLDELQTRFSNWIESRPEWHDGGEGIQVRVTPT